MGERANLIIVKDGRWQLYYDHWCGDRLDSELFWGPRLARDFIEQRQPVNSDDWLDEIWCAGAAIVDLDRRDLVFFGGDAILFDVPLRRAKLALMGETWPGWDIHWAHEGIVAIGARLGQPADMFLSDRTPDVEERFRVHTDDPDSNCTLLTTKITGDTVARRVGGDQESLELGPDHLDVLNEIEGERALDWSGRMPTGGVHLDFDDKAISVWWADGAAAVEARVAAAWPGWSVTWLQSRFERQLELAGLDIRLPVRPWVDLQADIVALMKRWCHWQGENPAADLARRLDAPVNPPTREARGSVGDTAEKQRILAALSERVPVGAP